MTKPHVISIKYHRHDVEGTCSNILSCQVEHKRERKATNVKAHSRCAWFIVDWTVRHDTNALGLSKSYQSNVSLMPMLATSDNPPY